VERPQGGQEVKVPYDVAVVGLGGAGSAAAYHLARRGLRVLGLERFSPGHTRGSSHGHTRITRQAYFEHPDYVPLLLRAYELWEDLQAQSGTQLLWICGGLLVGAPHGHLVTGALRSAKLHHLPHELLDAREVRSRFPAFSLEDPEVAVYEPRAGILFPEACVQAHQRLAAAHGADLRFSTRVLGWESDGARVRVRTEEGWEEAANLVLAAGAWMPQLAGLPVPLTVERQVVFWFAPRRPEWFGPDRCPVFVWETEEGFFYGIPAVGGRGFKAARHHGGQVVDPEDVPPAVPEDAAWLRAQLARRIPEADGGIQEAAVCLYTNTPDEHFLLDRHPQFHNVVVCSACSGHGFKFTSVVGEVVADLVTAGSTGLPVGFLSLGRFRRGP
jgi:sarcosine oxidase